MKRDENWWGRSLIEALQRLDEEGDRRALATLRRSLQREPGRDAEVFRYVVPYLPPELSRRDEAAAFLTAALFATHPEHSADNSLGTAFHHLAARANPESAERRFTALLNAEAEDLPQHLRQAVSLLRSHDIGLDWECLLNDLLRWEHPEGYIQRRWAKDFWGYRREEPEKTDGPEGNEVKADA